MSFTSSATRFSSLLPSTSSVAAVSALGGNPRPCAHPPLSLLCAPPLLVSSPFHPSALSLFSSSPPRPSSTPTLFSPLLPSLDSLVHVVSAGHRQVQLAGGLTGEAGGEGGGPSDHVRTALQLFSPSSPPFAMAGAFGVPFVRMV